MFEVYREWTFWELFCLKMCAGKSENTPKMMLNGDPRNPFRPNEAESGG